MSSTVVTKAAMTAVAKAANAVATGAPVTFADAQYADRVLSALATAALKADTADRTACAVSPNGAVSKRDNWAARMHAPWAVAYAVTSDTRGKAVPASQRDGGVCAFVTRDKAVASVAQLATTLANGPHVVTPGSALAYPAVVVPTAQYALARAALRVRYAAWLQAVGATADHATAPVVTPVA